VGFLFQWNMHRFSHQFRFVARATSEDVGKMFDAVLAGVGRFASRHAVWSKLMNVFVGLDVIDGDKRESSWH
jgi:hypothetical protein